MDTEAFQQHLRDRGAYVTPPDAQSAMDRVFGRFDAWFYARVISVVAGGARLATAGRYDRLQWSRSSHRSLRACERCGAKVSISGAHALAEAGGPAVIVSNHMSMAETFLLPCMVLAFGEASFIVKESLLRYPLFGRLLSGCHPIGVSRTNARQDLKDVLEKGVAALRGGRSVVVFPQATRTPYFQPAAFNTLGIKLAARAGVPVVPLALKTDFQANGRWIKEFGPLDRGQAIHFAFAPPRAAAGREKAAHAEVVAFIRERFTAWGGEVRDGDIMPTAPRSVSSRASAPGCTPRRWRTP